MRALERVTGHPSVRQAVTETLSVGGEFVGTEAGINRIGDVSSFDDADVRVLSTLASQLSTTLENSRLTDTLSELRSLKEQLEALIESKDRLVASVSHELRTPLTGVIGLAAVIRETAGGKFDTDTLDMLDLIVSQGNELANIVEDLLAHARAEAGTLTLKPERFDLTKEMALVSASHQLEPAASDALQSVWAFADPLRVRQIVRNLITNARRYGGPAVSLEVETSGDFVTVSVVDDGHGVPLSDEVSIFEPYHSAHDQRTQPGSVGLGFSGSRSMARMMGGELSYSRRLGDTLFTLRLPAIPQPRSDVKRVDAA